MAGERIKERDTQARKVFHELTGKTVDRRGGEFTALLDGRTRYPFTIRLPVQMYARLRDKAEKERRSVAAQVEMDLEGIYG